MAGNDKFKDIRKLTSKIMVHKISNNNYLRFNFNPMCHTFCQIDNLVGDKPQSEAYNANSQMLEESVNHDL